MNKFRNDVGINPMDPELTTGVLDKVRMIMVQPSTLFKPV